MLMSQKDLTTFNNYQYSWEKNLIKLEKNLIKLEKKSNKIGKKIIKLEKKFGLPLVTRSKKALDEPLI